MEKIDFLVGSEKRFSEFISGLNEKDKIALISHTDLDGMASAKVVNEVLNADVLKFVNYTELDNYLIEELKKEGIKKIVLTDLLIKNEKFLSDIGKFADVLVIDHHLFKKDFNSDKVVFLNAQGYCAAYISYYLFSKIQDLSTYDWLVASASVADCQYTKISEWLGKVYEKYGDKFVGTIEGVRESKKFWPLIKNISNALVYFDEDKKRVYDSIGKGFGDIGDLEKYSVEVEKDIKDCINRFEKEKIQIKGGYFWEISSRFHVKSLVINSISFKNTGETFIFGEEKGKYYLLSARRQDGAVNVADLLSSLVEGFEGCSAGGHARAAGGQILSKDKEKFKKRLFNF